MSSSSKILTYWVRVVRSPWPRRARTALAAALDRYLSRRPATALARTRSGALIPVTTSDLNQRYLLMSGVWEPHLTAWLAARIRPGGTITDIGARTLTAATLACPAGHVITIGPSQEFCQALAAAAAGSGLDQVRIIQAAVSNTDGTLTVLPACSGWPVSRR